MTLIYAIGRRKRECLGVWDGKRDRKGYCEVPGHIGKRCGFDDGGLTLTGLRPSHVGFPGMQTGPSEPVWFSRIVAQVWING